MESIEYKSTRVRRFPLGSFANWIDDTDQFFIHFIDYANIIRTFDFFDEQINQIIDIEQRNELQYDFQQARETDATFN